MRGIPLTLVSSVTMPTQVGQVISADLGQMQMEHRTPIEITEIRFTINPTWNSNDWAAEGLIGVSLDAGPFNLTNGFIPVWAADPCYNPRYQQALNEAGTARLAFVRWRLPQPMVLPSGFVLRPRFQWMSSEGVATVNSPTTISIAVVGRSLIDGKYPRTTRVPYMTTWIPPDGALATGQLDLMNNIDKEVTAHRLVGRMISGALGYGPMDGTFGCPYYRLFAMNSVIRNKLIIRKSTGYYITQNPTPFLALFPMQGAVLPIEQRLAPGDSYTISSDTAASANFRPHISLIASREEQI